MAEIDELTDAASIRLDPDEIVISAILGLYENPGTSVDFSRLGILLATDRRIVFFAQTLKAIEFEFFPYAKIAGVRHHVGVIGDLEFLASGSKVRMKWIGAGMVEEFASVLRSQMAKAAIPESRAKPPAGWRG